MNKHDYFQILTKGLKFSGDQNKEVLKKLGYTRPIHKKDLILDQSIRMLGQNCMMDQTKEHSQVQPGSINVQVPDEGDNPRIRRLANQSKLQDLRSEDASLLPENIVDEDQSELQQYDSCIQPSNPSMANMKTKEKLALMKKEEINHVRNVNKIHVYGTDIPAALQTFQELETQYKVNKQIITNLLNEGYDKPTPIQMQSWSLMFKRRELLASAPTGSGKTAGFLVPIIHHLKMHKTHGFRAVILAPTRELAKQIVRESDRLSNGTGIKTSIIDKVKGSSCLQFLKKFDILVTTPNRLIFLMGGNEHINAMLLKVEWLVVDESDRLYEAGKNGFRDQLAAIYKACSGPNVVRTMFSATFDFHVEEWCKLNLNNPVTVSIGARNASCPDVEQELVFCGSDRGKLIALREIIRKGYEPPVLIFVQTKERARQLYKELIFDDIKIACIHSDQTQSQRDSVVQSFRERKIWILICTELMGRGIDFIGVNMVINYDFPPSVVSYIHRVGRTGRAGRKGVAKTFWTLEDKPLLRSVAQIIKNSGSKVDDFLLNLKKENKRVRTTFSKSLPERGFISEASKQEKFENDRRKIIKIIRRKNTKKSETQLQTDKGQKRKKDNLESLNAENKKKLKVDKTGSDLVNSTKKKRKLKQTNKGL